MFQFKLYISNCKLPGSRNYSVNVRDYVCVQLLDDKTRQRFTVVPGVYIGHKILKGSIVSLDGPDT